MDYKVLDREMLCNFWSGLRKQSFTKAVTAERAAMEREGNNTVRLLLVAVGGRSGVLLVCCCCAKGMCVARAYVLGLLLCTRSMFMTTTTTTNTTTTTTTTAAAATTIASRRPEVFLSEGAMAKYRSALYAFRPNGFEFSAELKQFQQDFSRG